MSPKPTATQPPVLAAPAVDALHQDIRQLLKQARAQVGVQVNQALVLQGERAAYGAGVLKTLAERLTRDYGSGCSHLGLTRMAKFYDSLPDEQKVATLSQRLSCSRFASRGG